MLNFIKLITRLSPFWAILSWVLSPYVLANEEFIKKQAAKQLGKTVQSVHKTPYAGLYEVYADNKIFYTDSGFNFMVVGAIVDNKKNINYTDWRMRKLVAIDVRQLPPLENAIKISRLPGPNQTLTGDPKSVLYVFSDPLCGHCQEMEKTLALFPDLTVYVFLVPNDNINRGATRMAEAIWCAPDRVVAYLGYMRQGVIPSFNASPDCKTPFKKNRDAASLLGIVGTPGLIFADGYYVQGKLDEPRFRSMLKNTTLK